MSIWDFFHKERPIKEFGPTATKAANERSGFVLGVQDKLPPKNSDNVVVVGKVNGTVCVGDAVYASNIGDDDGNILQTSVLGIEIAGGKKVNTAADCHVDLLIEMGAKQKIKCGTVLYTRNISAKDVHDAYISALCDVYVLKNELNIRPEEAESLSITDCQELINLFSWYNSKRQLHDEETLKRNREKEDYLANILCKKLLLAESMYCVYSKVTGEPYLFSRTIDQQDGTYCCTPPQIMLFTKAHKRVLSPQYPTDKFEIREVVNDDDKKVIENFLGDAFYLNGACGAAVNNELISLSAEMLVPKPDYSSMAEINRPVTNSGLERWLLLMAQLGDLDTTDSETIYKLYVHFMQQELLKAKFLIPMKHEGEIPPADGNGKTVLNKNSTMCFAVMDGKYDRPAVIMYTDWKRLYAGMGEGWESMIKPIDGMIENFDCAINLSSHKEAGCYIDKKTFNSISK